MNLQETIRKVLLEQKLPSTPNELIKTLPEGLKKLFFSQWSAKQNPKWHPEGNTLKHIIVVLKRAYTHYPDDPNMIMAALFHDLGKSDTYKINPKTGEPTAYGHENKSTDYVEEFKDWIESFNGTDVGEIKYLVQNHMKVKPSTWDVMKDTKKEPIQKHPAFDKLMGFTNKLDGGGTDLKESIRKVLREGIKDKMSELINTHGLLSAIKFMGGWDNLEDILGVENISTQDEINFIKEVARENNGLSVFDFDEDPIFYNDTGTEHREIIFFGLNMVTVQVFDTETFNDLGNFHVSYENLSDDIITEIFELLIKEY